MARALHAVGTVVVLGWCLAFATAAIARSEDHPKCPGARPACGNGTVQGNEQCDGNDLGGGTCTSLGYSGGGTLGCTGACVYDTSGCMCAPGSTCGNGIKDGDEQCDGSDLGAATCASLGYTLDGTLACTEGCGYDTSGCKSQRFPPGGVDALAYVDNGDGTITDSNTGLVWEKKSADGTIHEKDMTYIWSNAFAVH